MSDQDAKDYKEQLDAYMNLRKNADGQAGYEYQKPSQESYAAGPACSALDIPPTMTCRELVERVKRGEKWKVYEPAPDEALIEEIAGEYVDRHFVAIAADAIRKYIRRSAGKERG